MNTQERLDTQSWAERTFGNVDLHDGRRTRRTVQAATQLAENPLGSLPAHMQTWKDTKALYRLLNESDVTFAALMQPHLQQTREQAQATPVVLLVQDTTDIDLSHRHKISGVGQIGNERGRGFFVQTVLALHPQTGAVLGCIAQEPFVRISAPEGEQRYQRRKRDERETDVWMRKTRCHWHTKPGKHVGPCRRSRRGYVPVFPVLPSHPDALSGSRRPESADRGERGRDQVFAGTSTVLAQSGVPSL